MKIRRTARSSSATERAIRLVPPTGDLTEFIKNVADHRGRSIQVLDLHLPPTAPSGAWIESEDVDWLVIDEAATPARRAAILCHELAHMLLGHQGRPLATSEVSALTPGLVRGDVAARFLGRQNYDAEQEHQAEILGTLLAAKARRLAEIATTRRGRVANRVQ